MLGIAAVVPRARSLSPAGTWRVHLLLVGLLLALSITIKLSIWQLRPQIFNDTPGYLVPAVSLLDGRGYGVQENSFRAPTFPLYVAALLLPLDRTHLNTCTDAHRAVCIGQAAQFADGRRALSVLVGANVRLGLVITVLLYALGWMLTRNYLVAFFTGAGYALNIATAFWEISILTETLTTFLVIVVIFLTLRAFKKGVGTSIALGIVLGVLALCHQLFLGYAIVPFAFLLIRGAFSHSPHLARRLVPVLLIPTLAVLAWSGYNYFANGVFTPSTVGGYVLVQMVYPVVQNAPEGYDGITQTLVGYRDAQFAQVGNPTGAVFRAWRDMMNETDFTFAQVSSKLTTLTIYLAWNYPSIYLSSVVQSWGRFWEFAFFHYDPVPEGPAAWVQGFVENSTQAILNGLFWVSLVVLAAIAALRSLREQAKLSSDMLWAALLIALTILFAATFSSLTNLGDNERYRATVIELQYAIIILGAWVVWRLVRTPSQAKGNV